MNAEPDGAAGAEPAERLKLWRKQAEAVRARRAAAVLEAAPEAEIADLAQSNPPAFAALRSFLAALRGRR